MKRITFAFLTNVIPLFFQCSAIISHHMPIPFTLITSFHFLHILMDMFSFFLAVILKILSEVVKGWMEKMYVVSHQAAEFLVILKHFDNQFPIIFTFVVAQEVCHRILVYCGDKWFLSQELRNLRSIEHTFFQFRTRSNWEQLNQISKTLSLFIQSFYKLLHQTEFYV